MTTKYYLPFYGKFIIHKYGEVEWLPNVELSRSAEDQFKMNMKNGHFDNKKLIGEWTNE